MTLVVLRAKALKQELSCWGRGAEHMSLVRRKEDLAEQHLIGLRTYNAVLLSRLEPDPPWPLYYI